MPNFIDSRYGIYKASEIIDYWLLYQVKHYDGGGVNKVVDVFTFAVVRNYIFAVSVLTAELDYIDPSTHNFLGGSVISPPNQKSDIQIISLLDEDLTIDDIGFPLTSDDTTFFKTYRQDNNLTRIFNENYCYCNLSYGFIPTDRNTPLCFVDAGGNYIFTIIRQTTLKRWSSWSLSPRLPTSWVQIDPDDRLNDSTLPRDDSKDDDDVTNEDRNTNYDEDTSETSKIPGTTTGFTPAVGYGSTVFGNRFINYPLKAKIDNEMTVWMWNKYPQAIATWYVLYITFNLPVPARKYFLWSGLGFTQYTDVDQRNESEMYAIIRTPNFQRTIKNELHNKRPFETFTNQLGMELDYLFSNNTYFVPAFTDLKQDTQDRIRGIKTDWTIYSPESFNWQGQLSALLTQFGYLP